MRLAGEEADGTSMRSAGFTVPKVNGESFACLFLHSSCEKKKHAA